MEAARRRHALGHLRALLGAGVLLVGGACGLEPGSGSCIETSIKTPPIRVTNGRAPLTLSATLEADGKPVVGADLIFIVHRMAPGRPPIGIAVGKAPTGPDGVALYTDRGGFEKFVLGNARPTGYGAEFRPVAKVAGVQYCRSEGRGELTLG